MITDFRLMVFVTVARTLSFTRAASVLNVSQPAISKHIKELEVEFGEPLFNRKGNSISLTPKAQEIIPLVETILDGYGSLSDTIDPQGDNYDGVLRIGASTTIAQYVLPSILAKFALSYPRVRLNLISANSDDIVKMLHRKEIEVALIEDDNIDHSVHYSVLGSDEIVLVSAHSLGSSISLGDVSRLPLVIREEGSGTLSVILSALKHCGISRRELNIRMQLGSSEAILRYIISSGDYAFMSVRVAREHIQRRELFVSQIDGLNITREFRFVSLHGQSGRLISIFKEFCNRHYNF